MKLSKNEYLALKKFADHLDIGSDVFLSDDLFIKHNGALARRGLIEMKAWKHNGMVVRSHWDMTRAGHEYLDEQRLKWQNRFGKLLWSILVPIFVSVATSILTVYLLLWLGLHQL